MEEGGRFAISPRAYGYETCHGLSGKGRFRCNHGFFSLVFSLGGHGCPGDKARCTHASEDSRTIRQKGRGRPGDEACYASRERENILRFIAPYSDDILTRTEEAHKSPKQRNGVSQKYQRYEDGSPRHSRTLRSV